uniref:Armadillo repeat-containing domain-containing protein n=1 Tax=Globisporangium ultimum (strain ATCC 200006 / CBS 805.95 / DAOM BR144) TaxID=431595 RepID=K3WSJ3_GLOUD
MKKVAAKKQISQETFDECVRENMEEFDMDLAEATQDAVQQFESQQVDLSNIIKHMRAANGDAGGDAQHENILDQIKRIIKELRATTEKMKGTAYNNEDEQPVVTNLTQLQALCDEVPEAAVVAGRNNAIDILLDLIDGAASSTCKSTSVLETVSAILATLCTDNSDNQDFVGQSGMARLAAVLNAPSTTESNVSAVARVLALVKTACAKHEANKTHFTNAQGVDALFAHFEKATQDESLSKQLALVLRVLTVNDDPNATFSQAQETIKQLVAKDVIPYILEIVRGNHDKPEMLSVWLVVLKQLAITEDNCKKIYELEGLELLQQVMIQHEKHLVVMMRCITVLRNVAAADELKAYIIKSGGVERVLTGMRLHLDDPSLQQHACATLAAIALRAPENSLRIVDLGGARQIAFAMRTHRENTALLRQASLAIRNMVARCVELRPRILDEDIEPLLRDAQRYRGCGDEAYAALRDLGCDIQLSSFGSVATTAQFNPVNIASNQLLESVDEAAEAPFAGQR